MVGRGELTDAAWNVIEPLLPTQQRGGQWRDHRTVIKGILWKLRTGAPWRDLPERYGAWQTCADASTAGGVTAPGIGCWPTCRPNPMPWARSSGKSVSTVRRPARTNTPVAPGVGPVGPTKKGGSTRPRRRVTAQPRRTDDHVSSGVRWQRPSALDRHPGGATP